jgi:hypothetical protein
MLKVLETKSERIELELKADPTRSDREIARICGVDHKTVAARRAKIPHSGEMGNSNSPLGENSPPDSPLGSLFAQEDSRPLQDCPPGPENCPADSAPAEMASQSVTCDTSEPAATVLLPAQGEITIGWNNDGDMILRQSDWPNEDAVIIIARDYLWMFIDRLTDAMGIPSTKGLMR